MKDPQIAGPGGPRVLIIVQNLHVPFDRRVWLECQTLVGAGYDVTVVCPRGPESKAHEVIESVEVYTYPQYAPGGSKIEFVWEYAYSFLATAWLVLRARRRRGHFQVLQACNPPDIFWPLARWLRGRDGTRFVFDHHDLCPELYESRFHRASGLAYRGLRLLERATFSTADRVCSTNESYAAVAVERGRKSPHEVTVVRTGPDPRRLKAGERFPELRRGREHLVAYLGVMGPQDGVDNVLQAADILVNRRGRRDLTFFLMGGGDCHAELLQMRGALGLEEYVELPGRVSDQTVQQVFSTADIGLCPDPMNPLNDVSTMNKTMEYLAFGLPVVSFDLHETRVSAGDSALYADAGDIEGYAQAIEDLLDDPERRATMGSLGRRRVEHELAWDHQQGGYLRVFDELTGRVDDPVAAAGHVED